MTTPSPISDGSFSEGPFAFEGPNVGDSDHNLLVVSDLHIGDSLRPTDAGYLKQVARLNRAFCRFLKHYAKHRVGDRPWRLVIAGDMIDFLHAGLADAAQGDPSFPSPSFPSQQDTAPGTAPEPSLHAPPRREPLPRRHSARAEASAIRWLERVMDRERRVFRVLAAFVATGNRLVIIKGNHDAQFHWEGVQRRFAEFLTQLERQRRVRYFEGRTRGVDGDGEATAFQSRITFCRWFYYERDLVYIEHGNQYDAFCSFEHVLSPVYPDRSELEDPISHRTYREFASLVRGLDVHNIDQWRLVDYVRWVASLGPKLVGRLAYTYFASIAWMFDMRRQLGTATRKGKDEHLRRRRLLTHRFGMSEETLQALDELRERPAGMSLFTGIRMLYMDRIFLVAFNLLVALVTLCLPVSWIVKLSVVLGLNAVSIGTSFVLDRYREVDAHPKLLRMAHRIARLVKVPFVVFGHSHVPIVADGSKHEGERDSWYFNTGSWTPGSRTGLTHVCIVVHEGRARAELRRWCTESHRPLKLAEKPNAA